MGVMIEYAHHEIHNSTTNCLVLSNGDLIYETVAGMYSWTHHTGSGLAACRSIDKRELLSYLSIKDRKLFKLWRIR